jgi:hypothetical protein
LLRPADWGIESRKLVFMMENQGVFPYGIPAGPQPLGDDPPVFVGEDDEPDRWYKINGRCSAFLLLMLHAQAAYGEAQHGPGARGPEEGSGPRLVVCR